MKRTLVFSTTSRNKKFDRAVRIFRPTPKGRNMDVSKDTSKFKVINLKAFKS